MSRPQTRIEKALDVASQWGGFDGAHHKAWAIDQIVRVLTCCPVHTETAVSSNGVKYTFKTRGKSKAYERFVCEHKAGKDGPNTYDWDEGIPP